MQPFSTADTRDWALTVCISTHAPQHSAIELNLLGGVPLGGQQHGEALALVGGEPCLVRHLLQLASTHSCDSNASTCPRAFSRRSHSQQV
jgi:hypothetical protein